MADEDTTIAKTTCKELQWLEYLWRRWKSLTCAYLAELYLTTVHSISNEKHVLTFLSTFEFWHCLKEDLAF